MLNQLSPLVLQQNHLNLNHFVIVITKNIAAMQNKMNI